MTTSSISSTVFWHAAQTFVALAPPVSVSEKCRFPLRNATHYLVLVQLAVLILLLALLLEGDNDEAHKDVHHEEGDEDDVDDEEDGDVHPVVEDGPHVFFVRVYGSIQESGNKYACVCIKWINAWSNKR